MTNPFANVFGNIWGANSSPSIGNGPPKQTSAAEQSAAAQMAAASRQYTQVQYTNLMTTVNQPTPAPRAISMQSMLEARKIAAGEQRLILSGLNMSSQHRFQINNWWFTLSLTKYQNDDLEVRLTDDSRGETAAKRYSILELGQRRMDDLVPEALCQLLTEIVIFIQLFDGGEK